MNKFEYEIKLNDNGRPYVHLEDNKIDAEDKFACIEISKYLIFELLNTENEFPDDFIKDLAIAGDMLNGISGKLGELIKGQNDVMDNIDDLINNKSEEE